MSDSLLNDYLAECREHLQGIEADILLIEEAGGAADTELVNKVFRAAHSIKGGAGFFNLEKIKVLAHRTETVLDMIRSKKMEPQAETVNILLTAFDTLREMVNNSQTLEQFDISMQLTALQDLVTQYLPNDKKASISKTVTLTSKDSPHRATLQEIDVQAAEKDRQFIYLIEYDLLHDIDRTGKSPVTLLGSLSKIGVIVDSIFEIASLGTLDDTPAQALPVNLIYRTVLEPSMIEEAAEVSTDKIHVLSTPHQNKRQESDHAGASSVPLKPEAPMEIPVETKPPAPASQGPFTEKPLPAPEAPSPRPVSPKAPDVHAPETIRIDVEALDALMVQAGELVLGRNQLLDAIARNDSRSIAASAQRISFVTSELQEAVMRTRLQPIGNVFSKFPRVVRDMAQQLKKELRLQIEGKEVELDKTIIEGLSDPLTHMVRNAADHGIESPETRSHCGKSPTGTIVLRAFHEAGYVTVEISDDGKGINAAKVAAKALSMGLVPQERINAMTDEDKIALIFLPGLSTSEKVTETSGRGVGMDVVKTNLDRLGGKVEIHSTEGSGTTFRIKLPLTLAIIPSLIVTQGGERFALPQVNVEELLRVPAAQVKSRIEVVGDSEVVSVRENLIPLVRFADVLGVVGTYIDPSTGKPEIDRRKTIADRRSPHYALDEKAPRAPSADIADGPEPNRRGGADRRTRASSDINIAIIAAGLTKYGLVVDELRNTEEIVVKPLGRHLKGLGEYAGATIMGDGDVALILDATGIAVKAGITSVAAAARAKQNAEESGVLNADAANTLLLFDNQPGERCAIPLDLVQRVERIAAQRIETKGGKRTMQYRESSLPVVQLADAAAVNPVPLSADLAVVVSTVADHEIGLLCSMPVAVVESCAAVDTVIHRQKGISGSAVLKDTTVLIVDLYEIVDTLYPEWSVTVRTAVPGEKSGCILLAEDSDFFRGQVTRYLEEAGFTVIGARDGQEGWELYQSNVEKIQLVVTDIEMPRLNGMELCSKIRADLRGARLPVIALTSLAGEEDQARGKAAGITEYLVKLDRDRLISAVRAVVTRESLQ
jgi:two-component system, chemotaxis family, sensor kinase CheA